MHRIRKALVSGGVALAVTWAPAGAAQAAPAVGPASAPVATVSTSSGSLNLRTGPSTLNSVVGSLANGTRLAIACQVVGQQIASPLRNTGYWDRLTNGTYVSDAYVSWSPARPRVRWCGADGVQTVATVATGSGSVNLRSGPGTAYAKTGELANGTELAVICQVWGERIAGGITTNAWNRLVTGRYVTDALVAWKPSRPQLPWCGQEPPTIPASVPDGFLARVVSGARLGYRQYKVPASVTIAQAILESGWGKSWLTRRDHNYFGIKCFGSPGPIAVGCRAYATHECGGGKCWATTAQFRAYRNAAGSMSDHGRFLVVNPRYHDAFRYSRAPERFAIAIHKAGYATSPTYSTNLIKVMRKYNLYRYDR
jgi:uncharacterized protein YraI